MDRSAYVTIIGKVFIPDEEIQELVAAGSTTILTEGDCPIRSEEEAFDFLAKKKISEFLRTDDPLKHLDTIVDFSTFQ